MAKFSNEHESNMWWGVLLLALFAGLLLGSFFNRTNLAFTDAWSFFWHQFLWIVSTALVTRAAYLIAAPQLQPIRRKRNLQRR